MVDLATLHELVTADPAATVIRERWTPCASWAHIPPDSADWSAHMTFTATIDAGTVAEVRFRVAGTGTATTPVTITGSTPNRYAPWLGLGVGNQLIILEARRVSGTGALRITRASGSVALSSLVDATEAPAEGTAVLTGGPLVATATGTFTSAVPRNVVPPEVSGVPVVGELLSAVPGEWTGIAATREYRWQVELAVADAVLDEDGEPVLDETGDPILSEDEEIPEPETPVAVAPSIVTHPASQTVGDGGVVTFSVVASGTAPLAYQWQHNGSGSFADISGATSSTYTTGALAVANSGRQYRVVVTNTAGGITSNAATVTVTAAEDPALIGTPKSNWAFASTVSVTLDAAPEGALLLARGAKNSAGTIEGIDGWDELDDAPSGTTLEARWYSKTAGPSEPTTVTFEVSGATSIGLHVWVIAHAGVVTLGTEGTSSGDSVTSLALPSMTVPAGALLLADVALSGLPGSTRNWSGSFTDVVSSNLRSQAARRGGVPAGTYGTTFSWTSGNTARAVGRIIAIAPA